MSTATIVLSIVLGLLFVITGGVKAFGVKQSLEIRDRLKMSPRLWPAIGTLESAGAVGLLVGLAIPVLGLLASIGLAALMLGAIAARVRVRDTATAIAVDAVVLMLVVTLLILRAAT